MILFPKPVPSRGWCGVWPHYSITSPFCRLPLGLQPALESPACLDTASLLLMAPLSPPPLSAWLICSWGGSPDPPLWSSRPDIFCLGTCLFPSRCLAQFVCIPLIVCLLSASPLDCEVKKEQGVAVLFSTAPSLNEQVLGTHSNSSTNTCWMNKWMERG